MRASQTINPLHFEDLEPHRFEDLVRQLIYDYKVWRSLEATGRSGSDEGFDVRAWEIAGVHPEAAGDQEQEEEQEELATTGADRLWLVQCKREKSISPTKLSGYAETIEAQSLYGVIYVAACDFSKKARDAFYSILRQKGIQEIHLWGKAELEDMLFQPKNDHLLFAYFGISLLIRRRSLQAQIRSKLSTKRKTIKCLGEVTRQAYKPILLRDANDTSYPYKSRIPDFKKNPRWIQSFFVGHYADGIRCVVRKHFAYLADDGVHWDYVKDINDAIPNHDPWAEQKERQSKKRYRAWHFWFQIPERNRGWLQIARLIPYEKIIAIDPDGDEIIQDPHIYVTFDPVLGPFADLQSVWLEAGFGFGQRIYFPDLKNRVDYFPKNFPEPKEPEKTTSKPAP